MTDPRHAHPARRATTHQTKRKRALQLLLVVLVLRPFGNLALAWGVRHAAGALSINPLPYLTVMLNPYVASGILMLIGGLLFRMALLSVADLSYVLPLTATGYIISSILGWYFLQEHITLAAWAGIVLIFLGTAIVGSTSADTTRLPKNPASREL